MDASKGQVLFLGNGRCYHTMDWFRSAQTLRPELPPVLATELIDGESFQKLVAPGDRVERLLVIDRILFNKQSRAGDVWRNLVKLFLLPVQVVMFRRILRRYPAAVVHAHSMYYIALARFSGCRYVATPQGSEVLARPQRSLAYRFFARTALEGAARITVDSVAMQGVLQNLFGISSALVQNGIDISAIRDLQRRPVVRDRIVSIRGLVSNYHIDRILDSRNASAPGTPVDFCYPFSDANYRAGLQSKMIGGDRDLHRLARRDLYQLLLSAYLVISIPSSDSSPRSVYEAIFCGCIVATTGGSWISQLPLCMRERIIVVNPDSDTWLPEALRYARTQCLKPFMPSAEALDQFDQQRSMRRFYDEVYPVALAV